MSGDAPRMFWNTKERSTSTKRNREVDLVHRMVQETMRAMLGSDTDRTGVVHGLTVSVNPGTMQVNVARGLAIVFDAGKAYPDSQYRWIEATGSISATAAAANGVNPRWDVVEIRARVANSSAVLDIYNSTTSSFSGVTLVNEQTNDPEVRVRSGTAAAVPEFPAGEAGWIPLAYLYIPAAAASINTTDVVHCRPLLRSGGASDVGSEAVRTVTDLDVRGGGIEATFGGANIRRCTGRFPGSRHRFVVAGTVNVTAATIDGGVLPVADALVYFYAVKPPYPAGYDANLVDREFVPLTTARTRFPWGIAGEGAVVICSTSAPSIISAQGESSGNGSLPVGPFDNTAIVSARANWVYLGAAFWDVSAVGLADQNCEGKIIQVSTPTCSDIGAGGAANYNLRQSNGGPVGVSTHLLPATAIWIHCQVELNDAQNNVGASVTIDVQDEQTVPANVASWWFAPAYDIANASFTRVRVPWLARVNPTTGQVQVFAVTGSYPNDTARIWAVAYRDAILELR